jgi:hypothetical protein
VKQYHHYAYKMEAAPPFRICAVSEELTLVTRKKDTSAQKRWAAAFFFWGERGALEGGGSGARLSGRRCLWGCRRNAPTHASAAHLHPPPPGPRRDWTHQRIWKDTSQTAYVSGLFLDGPRLLISYGSSDIDARLLTMSVADMEGLFQTPPDCSGAEVQDAGSGEALPAVLAVSGPSAAAGGAGGAGGGNATDTARHKQHRRAHHKGP